MEHKVQFILLLSSVVLFCEARIQTQCPRNETFGCVRRCSPERTCFNQDQIYNCGPPETDTCHLQCVCKENYYRNHDNQCVSIEDCKQERKRHTRDLSDAKCNRPNEESKLVAECPPETTCKTRGVFYKCTEEAANKKSLKCVCKNGYYRNAIGDCISEAQCDQCKVMEHEFFTCSTECDNECSTLGKQNRTNCPIVNIICNKRCYCEDGYARDSNNNCIPAKDCPLQCNRPNEEPGWVAQCPGERTCKTRDALFKCSASAANNKTRKCICKEGYYRNAIGECISGAQCDQCKVMEREFFTCSTDCDNECSTLGKQNRTNCPIVNIDCNERCYCEDGYARDSNNNCIPVKDCQLDCNRPNEESRWVAQCPPERTCKNKDIFFRCTEESANNKSLKCVCKNGYYRNAIGDCISEAECDLCKVSENEFFTCSTACDNECAKLGIQNRTKCPIVNIICNKRCYCEDGYARDYNKNCIPVKDCPNVRCTRENEELGCLRKGEEQATCSYRGDDCHDDSDSECCEPQCVCMEGYYRNAIGECISSEQCDQCPGEHEFFSCGKECDTECSSLDTQNRTNCPIDNVVCTPKCYCEDGYARDEDGNCIPVAKCNDRCKGPHEVFRKCKQICPPDTCASIVSLYNCDPKPPCEPGCNCQNNFLRSAVGKDCISTDQCAPFFNTPNQ